MNKLLRKQAVRAMNCLFLILSCGNCLAQETFPEIKVSYTNELQEGILKKKIGYSVREWYLSVTATTQIHSSTILILSSRPVG